MVGTCVCVGFPQVAFFRQEINIFLTVALNFMFFLSTLSEQTIALLIHLMLRWKYPQRRINGIKPSASLIISSAPNISSCPLVTLHQHCFGVWDWSVPNIYQFWILCSWLASFSVNPIYEFCESRMATEKGSVTVTFRSIST